MGFKLNDLFFNVFVKFISHEIYHLYGIQCFLHYNFNIKFNYLQFECNQRIHAIYHADWLVVGMYSLHSSVQLLIVGQSLFVIIAIKLSFLRIVCHNTSIQCCMGSVWFTVTSWKWQLLNRHYYYYYYYYYY